MARNKLGIKLTRGPKTGYDRDIHPDLIIKYGEKGKTLAQFCRDMKICPSTFYNWKSLHEEFKNACELYDNNKEAYYDDIFQSTGESSVKVANPRSLEIASKKACPAYRDLEKPDAITKIENLTINNINNLSYLEAVKRLEELNNVLGFNRPDTTTEPVVIEGSFTSSTED